jgi:endonuclease YncB( thermonuclease family)
MTRSGIVRTGFSLMIAAISVSIALGGDSLWGKVTAVPGPNIVVLNYGHGSVELRLVGVAVPSSFAEQARQFVIEMVLDKNARMRLESRDNDGRMVVELLTDEPGVATRDVGLQLIRLGLARRVDNFNDKYGEYHAAEAEARANRRGMWANP